jgi:hypothetical protein
MARRTCCQKNVACSKALNSVLHFILEELHCSRNLGCLPNFRKTRVNSVSWMICCLLAWPMGLIMSMVRPNKSWYLILVPSLSLTLSPLAEAVVGRGVEAGCKRKCWISVWIFAVLTPPLGGTGMGGNGSKAGVPC